MSILDNLNSAVTRIQTAGIPEFRYGDLMEVETETEWMNFIKSTQGKKYPFVYVSEQFEPVYDSDNGWYDVDLDLYIIGRSDEKVRAADRNADELPALRTIQTNLLRAIEIECGHWDSYSPQELFFNKNTTELDSSVNVIKLRLTGLKIDKNCLT